jgi:hypothetical protein
MRTLLFQNNVHKTEKVRIIGDEPRAINLTVRKGLKWSDLKVGQLIEVRETGAEVALDDRVWATVYDVKVMSFNDLMNYPRVLLLEHDPECTNYVGLCKVMRKVYDGFLSHELVTLVFYEVSE